MRMNHLAFAALTLSLGTLPAQAATQEEAVTADQPAATRGERSKQLGGQLLMLLFDSLTSPKGKAKPIPTAESERVAIEQPAATVDEPGAVDEVPQAASKPE